MSEYKNLRAAESEGVLTVTLNRPERLNALTDELLSALLGALKSAARNPSVRHVVLTGAGSGVCAGQGLTATPPRNPFSLRDHMRAAHIPLVPTMEALEQPVAALTLAVRLAAGPARALGLNKRALQHALQTTCTYTLEYEAHLHNAAGHSSDFDEGISAFLQKRKPKFLGA